MKITLTLTQRSSDYHVCIKGQPGTWEAGPTPRHAIDALLVSLPHLADAELCVEFSYTRRPTTGAPTTTKEPESR